MTFAQLSVTEWDAERGDVDFHVRLEQDNYVIDVFDIHLRPTSAGQGATGNADEAYLTSHECDTWEQAIRYCREYDGVTVI